MPSLGAVFFFSPQQTAGGWRCLHTALFFFLFARETRRAGVYLDWGCCCFFERAAAEVCRRVRPCHPCSSPAGGASTTCAAGLSFARLAVTHTRNPILCVWRTAGPFVFQSRFQVLFLHFMDGRSRAARVRFAPAQPKPSRGSHRSVSVATADLYIAANPPSHPNLKSQISNLFVAAPAPQVSNRFSLSQTKIVRKFEYEMPTTYRQRLALGPVTAWCT